MPRLKRPKDVSDLGGCPPGCGHTADEHIAFDVGFRDGEIGRDECPYAYMPYVDAWQAGHSVGFLDRESSNISRQTPTAAVGSLDGVVGTEEP